MSWLNKLPLKQKIVAGCFLVAALFVIPVLITFAVIGHFFIGLLLLIVLSVLTFPLARIVEKTLTESFDDISNVTHRIAKGDFTGRADESGSMGEVSRSFNNMVDKLKKILNEASQITKHVMDASQGIEDKNQQLKIVMAQVATSSNELAVGAGEISADIAGMTESIKDIETKVSNYARST